MYRKTWKNCFASICSINFKNATGQRVGSGTGFKINDCVVTNNHVFATPGAQTVDLTFVKEDGYGVQVSKTLSQTEFAGRLIEGLPETN